MNTFSHGVMKYAVDKFNLADKKVLDVGSYDVNGTYEDIFSDYTGLDIVDGPNVDIVSTELYRFPVGDNAYDVVVTGNTLEHVEDMYAFVKELARIAKEYVVIAVPSAGIGEHRPP